MRRLFYAILQLVGAALVILLFTGIWIVFDGLTDLGEKADVALVLGHSAGSSTAPQPLLDRVVEIYTDGEFPLIVVSAADPADRPETPAEMAKYLEAHGVASKAIVQDRGTGRMADTARNLADVMRARQLRTVMVVADYYYVTPMKLALFHEGIGSTQKAHIGTLRKEDAAQIGQEIFAIYNYIYQIYLLPGMLEIKEEALKAMGKARTDAEKAKVKVDKSLDGLSK